MLQRAYLPGRSNQKLRHAQILPRLATQEHRSIASYFRLHWTLHHVEGARRPSMTERGSVVSSLRILLARSSATQSRRLTILVYSLNTPSPNAFLLAQHDHSGGVVPSITGSPSPRDVQPP